MTSRPSRGDANSLPEHVSLGGGGGGEAGAYPYVRGGDPSQEKVTSVLSKRLTYTLPALGAPSLSFQKRSC